MKTHFAWTFHNMIAHPLSEIAHLVGLSKMSEWIHDASVPDSDEEHPPKQG